MLLGDGDFAITVIFYISMDKVCTLLSDSY